MRLDVKLYSQMTEKPEGIPEAWPAVCREVADDAPVTPDSIAMTIEEYNAYRALHQAEYDAWKIIQDARCAEYAARQMSE